MKTERRHELQTNTLADWLGHAIERVAPYSRIIAAAAVGAVVVLLVVWYQINRSRELASESWERYIVATTSGHEESLHNLIRDYPNTRAAAFALLWLADRNLDVGMNALFTNRPQANDMLRRSIEQFESLREVTSGDKFFEQRTALGLARAYESLNRLGDAREEYEQLVNQFPDGPYAKLAKSRLEDLDRPSTQSFYDWFAAQDPKPSTTRPPGGPGGNIPFEFESVPDEPFNSPLGNGATPGTQTPNAETPGAPAEDDTVPVGTAPTPSAEPTGEAPAGEAPAESAPESPPPAEQPPAETPPATP